LRELSFDERQRAVLQQVPERCADVAANAAEVRDVRAIPLQVRAMISTVAALYVDPRGPYPHYAIELVTADLREESP
jgi:hypothetical protein